MLQFITGRAGCGKTYYIKQQINEDIDNGKAVVLIIPEQSSFEYERGFLQFLGDDKYAKMQIFSFTRLAHHISQNTIQTKPAIDSFGKIMLMHRAVNMVSNDLLLYAKHKSDIIFVRSLISIAGEFKNSSLTPDNILALSGRVSSEILKQKLFEISLILQKYYALLNEQYSDPADDLERLSEILKEDRYFSGKSVYIDSFSGFTGSQLKIIGDILSQADDTYITLLADNESSLLANDLSLFSPVKKNARLIYDIAKQNNVKIAVPIKLNEQHRIQSNDIKHLEQNIYCQGTDNIFDGDSQNITIYRAIGAHDEAEFAAQTICTLVRSNDNIRYRDIAVVARDISQYNGIIDVVFKKYNIPLFMDTRQSVDSSPLFILILSLLEIAAFGFDSDVILRLLKTGLLGYSLNDISELENYCLTWNISGNAWLQPFVGHPDGLGYFETEESQQKLEHINSMRNDIIASLQKFSQDIADSTGDMITAKLYNLLCELNTPASLKQLAQHYYDNEQPQAAEDQDRLWNLFCDMAERCSQVLNGSKISIKEYYELFKITIENSTIGQIPIMLDSVNAGSADRMFFNEPKAVIILGANDGVFPANVGSSGLLSNYERNVLSSLGNEISDSPEMQAAQERLLCYIAMTCASQKLYISTQKNDLSGEAKLPSSMVNICIEMFSDSIIYSGLPDNQDHLFTREQAFELMTQLWTDNSTYSASLKHYFSNDAQYSQRYSRVNMAANSSPTKRHVAPNTIFDKRSIFLSASRIEDFYNCRYHYFCKYVMGANTRPVAKLDSRHFGTMLHYVMEKLLKNNGKDKFVQLSHDQCNAQIDAILNEYVDLYMGSLDNKPARFKILFRRWSNNCKLIAAQLAQELSQCDFEPVDFELKIGSDIKPLSIKLNKNKTIYITGSVDRVDTFKKSDKTYLRVIDYKSGKKQFKLCELLEGLNMQMLIYLLAITQNGSERYGNIIPSGILYMPSNAASVYRQPNLDKALKSLSSNLKMNGMLLDDSLSLLSMEKEGNGNFIPLKLNEDGTIRATATSELSAPFYTQEETEVIFRYIADKIIQMANELDNGEISPNPTSNGQRCFCDYCDYTGICNHDCQASHKAPAYSHRTAMNIITKSISADNNKHESKVMSNE